MRKNHKIVDGAVIPCQAEEASIIEFCNPDAIDREWLIGACGISAHNVSSALDPDELGRMEFEADHLSLIIKIPKNYCSEDNFLFKVISLGLFLYHDRLVLVSARDESAISEMATNGIINDLTDVLLRVLAGTISHFLGHLRVINMITDALEEKVNSSMANEHLLHMFTIEKSLVYYLNGINSNTVMMEKLRNNAKRLMLDEDHLGYLDDILIDNAQCNKQAEIYSNILTGLMDARGSIVNNNLSLLIKRLTIVSIVFMPLNVIAGMGGMSEFSAMTQGVPFWISYSCFATGLLFVAWLTYRIIKRYSGDSTSRRHRNRFNGMLHKIANRQHKS